MQDTKPLLLATDFPRIFRDTLDTLQVNLGYRCNQSCSHCHVNAGPTRTEMMSPATVAEVVCVIENYCPNVVDLTGGAPELNLNFRSLVSSARELGAQVIDRCNLTVLFESNQEDLPQFLADNEVTITASLPCYQQGNVDAQRGEGVFELSIAALKRLNSVGYGQDLTLNLVYNPQGPQLPPPQKQLEEDYRRELLEEYGIHFNALLTLTNMPISRFGAVLLAQNQYHDYMQLLRDNYQPANLKSVMCRSLVSIDWQGKVYDCDFNQMLESPVVTERGKVMTLTEMLAISPVGREIKVGEHCYGCTAGQGSSCSGALAG